MARPVRALGSCDVHSAVLYAYDSDKAIDITMMVAMIDIQESIYNTSMKMSIDVLDTQNILSDFPIVGEETLILEVSDAYADESVPIRFEMNVVAVTNLRILPKNDGISYRLELVSRTTFKSKIRRILTSFEKPPHEIAIDIFNEAYERITDSSTMSHYSERLVDDMRTIAGTEGGYGTSRYNIFDLYDGRSFTVEATDSDVRCVIPNYIPEQAMNFLCSISFNRTSSPSCSFRFFETKNGYFYVTDEFLYRQAITGENQARVKAMHYSSIPMQSVAQNNLQFNKLKSIDILKYSNSLEDLYSGAYNSNIISLDVLYGRVENIRYTHEDAVRTFNGIENDNRDKHSDLFINNVFNQENERVRTFVKNYDMFSDVQIRGDQFLPVIAASRTSYEHRGRSTMLSAKIDGRLDMSAGDIVELQMSELNSKNNRNDDNKLSGRYLVSTVQNTIKGGKLETTMTLIKYGWGV